MTVHRLEGAALACSRGPVTLFRDVDFHLASGEWLAVRGSNGSGKTTLLRCVAGLTRLDRGRIAWNGEPTTTHREAFNAELTYAGHLPGIKDDLSAQENLESAMRLRDCPIDDDSARRALAAVGLEKRRHLPARRLSAGQRRRIGLARLSLETAACWILDEPLTALDDDGQRFFATLLAAHLQRGGLAMIATHHDLPLAGARELRLGA